MSKFYVWIDNPGEQIETSQEFNAEAQRIRGFVKGETISSKVNNTALRQANLICVAMMEALGVSDQFDVSSSVEDLKLEVKSKLLSLISSSILIDYQKKIDENLLTESKEVVGAINELNTKVEKQKLSFEDDGKGNVTIINLTSIENAEEGAF